MGFHNLVNTRYFSEAATDWKRNGGRYTTAPQGSRDYYDYWAEQDKRIKYGYKVGDLWISGRHYGYLNFFPIARVPQEVINKALQEGKDRKGRISAKIAEKVISFPAFWEVDYEWWNYKHISWYGGEFMGVECEGGKHIGCLKARGAGFSYKEAWDGVYNYTFIPHSKSYYFAATEPFLVGDAIMDKVQSGLDWINQHCPTWKKNRQVKKTLMHQKASYLDEFGVERGTFSEIIGQIVDKPSKTRGKRGRKATFEEAGSFPGLEDALEVAMGSMRAGDMYVGQISVFGTGGEVGPGIQGLENIFNHPDSWDMIAFPNIWEEGMYGTECGYFVPCYRVNDSFMDVEGNVLIEAAIEADNKAREKKKKSGKPKDLDRRKAEYPRSPTEALQRLNGNGFNKEEIHAQIRRIESSKALQSLIRHGKLIRGDSGVEFKMMTKDKARPIEDFPHIQTEDLTGCVSIVERPFTDDQGNVPAGMYKLIFDSYYKEKSDSQESLWSCQIWKMDNPHDPSFTGLPVAWYTGRPTRYEQNLDIQFMLSEYYNAKQQGEIAGGGQAVVTRAKTTRRLHMICNEPDMVHNKELASKSAGNSYLMNMPTGRKGVGLSYLEDWHVQPRGIDENGNTVLNIHRVYDVAFLREMAKFNPEDGNFDRVSTAIIAMFEIKENYATQAKARRETKAFYSNQRVLFGGTGSGSSGATTTAY